MGSVNNSHTRFNSSLKKASFLLIFWLVSSVGYAADNDLQLFTLDFLWAGSWTNSFKTVDQDLSPELIFSGGTLTNRGEIKLGFPRLYLTLRLQGIDKRKLPTENEGQINPGIGLYYNGSRNTGSFPGNILGNSRLLWGALNEYGLPARLRNVWAKAPPYAENRKPYSSDLRTDPTTNKPEVYLYLGLPKWNIFTWGVITGFVSAQMDNEYNPAFGTGFEFQFDKYTILKLDGFYTQRILKEKTPSTWFSLSPPLPDREFRFYGIGAAFDARNWSIAADFGLSETFAWGRDLYANAALRIGTKPWKFSFAIDMAGSRYVGRDGNIPGAGFRIAGRLERQWIRSGLFRATLVLRSPGLGEDFNRSSIDIYFRPSAPPARSNPFFRFTRVSLSLSRNAVNPLKTEDSISAVLAFNISVLRFVFTGNIHSLTNLSENDLFLALPLPPCFDNFESSKISSEVSWNLKGVQFSLKAGYLIRAEKDNIWDFSLNTSLRFAKIGRISFRVAAPEFPDKWTYTLSWRLEKSF
ncbi:MAG: hypothetical protein LBI14_02080 [Treponema sp.]|jgi:hypothetical protein|nr:hypothetical protein [Treponema sp.]